MRSKERILAAINHEVPDRIPIDLGGCNCTTIVEPAYRKLVKYLNFKKEKINIVRKDFQTVIVDEKVLECLEVDTRGVFAKPPKDGETTIDDNTYINEMGIKFRMPENGLYYTMVEHPLTNATIEDLEKFEFPDPYDKSRVDGIEERAKKFYQEGQYAVYGDITMSGIFEPCWYLRGYEQFLVDLLVNEEFAIALMEKMLDFQIKRYESFLDIVGKYIDVVFVGDDLATASNTLMSAETYKKMIKPFQAKYFKAIHSMTDAKLMYHSCGNIMPFIDDLIEIGVDILNPIQVSAEGMDTKILKEKYGKQLVFCGGIDTTDVMPNGTPEDVRKETIKRIEDLGYEGYIVTAVHSIQGDVPPENIVELFNTAKRYIIR